MKLKNQEEWDNSGLQIGSLKHNIKSVMLTMDIDLNIISLARDKKIDLIITHHPFLFGTLKSIDYDTYDGSIIKAVVENNISLYSMHTSLDMAEYGVNYQLAEILGIVNFQILHKINNDGSGYGGVGEVEEISIEEYASKVKEYLNCKIIRLYSTNINKKVKRIAFCGGSGSEFISDAIESQADVYITGDIKYHQAQSALKNNLSIIDAGHFNTEYHILKKLKNVLNSNSRLEVMIYEKNTVEEIII